MSQDLVTQKYDLTGCDVTQLLFNYSVRILVADANSSISVYIESELLLQIGNTHTKINPGSAIDALSMAPLLHLLHKAAKSISFSNGYLQLEMLDGTRLSIENLEEEYPWWQAFGEGRFKEIDMEWSGTGPLAPWERA